MGEAELGPMRTNSREWSAVESRNLSPCDDFPLEPSQDESLKNAFEQVRTIDGQLLQPTRPLFYPYLAIEKKQFVSSDLRRLVKAGYSPVSCAKVPSGNASPGG